MVSPRTGFRQRGRDSSRRCLAEEPAGEPIADDQTLTAATLDRLLHHTPIVQVTGESCRRKDKRKAGQAARRTVPAA
jgi:hypothetical protein